MVFVGGVNKIIEGLWGGLRDGKVEKMISGLRRMERSRKGGKGW